MANPPVPPITWVGRDAVGNLVDVTAATSGLMSPLSVAAGGEQTIRLLGPYRVTAADLGEYASPFFFGDEIAASSLVISVYVVHRVPWVSGVANVVLEVDVAEENDFENTAATLLTTEIVVDGNSANIYAEPSDFVIALDSVGGLGSSVTRSNGALTHAATTRLVAWVNDDAGLTEGALDIYALIAEPAA